MHGRVEASWRAQYAQTQTQTQTQTHAQTQTQTHAQRDLITVTFNFTLPSNTVGELRIPAWRPADAISVWTGGVVVFAKGSFVPAGHVPGVRGGCLGTEPNGDSVVVIQVDG